MLGLLVLAGEFSIFAIVLESAASEQGMSVLDPPDFEPALLQLIDPWLDGADRIDVVGCGMVGSKQGWIEVPYLEVPGAPVGELLAAPTSDDRIEVLLCPGMRQVVRLRPLCGKG